MVVIDDLGSVGTLYRWISAGLLIQWAVVEIFVSSSGNSPIMRVAITGEIIERSFFRKKNGKSFRLLFVLLSEVIMLWTSPADTGSNENSEVIRWPIKDNGEADTCGMLDLKFVATEAK